MASLSSRDFHSVEFAEFGHECGELLRGRFGTDHNCRFGVLVRAAIGGESMTKLLDDITDTGRLIRACDQMLKAENDPARIEIVRHITNRMVEKYHSLMREMPTDDLLKMTGIDGLARSLAANEAVSRALEAIETPKEEDATT